VLVYVPFNLVMWAAVLASGIDPVVTGLVLGLTATAYSPARKELETANRFVRRYREQPTPELAHAASTRLVQTLSPNDRLERFYHPWTSYVIVPLFGLANAGIPIDGPFLAAAVTSPITMGIFFGYVIGKPAGIVGVSWVIPRLTRDKFRPAVGPAAVLGNGTIAAIPFTVSFLIASLAFDGRQLAEAKVGVLGAGITAAALTWVVYRVTTTLPEPRRTRALLGDTEGLIDLITDIDPERDHIRGPDDALVTLVEYGDFQCPYCGLAEAEVRELLSNTEIRYVWRHLPLNDVHPQAGIAAQASEAAGAQGAFWPMHDLLLKHQSDLRRTDLLRYAGQLGLDQERFRAELDAKVYVPRVERDIDSADLNGVSGTPTFFINGERHYGTYDAGALAAAVKAARVHLETAQHASVG
jgi:protein-disulfide isomerase